MTRKVLWLIALVVLLFPSIAAADVPKVGDKVWAMWTPEEPWYQGKAAKACAIGMHVAFDDGDKADRPLALIAVDRAPKKNQVKVGTRVLALFTDQKYYPGTVTKIADGDHDILYDDGDTHTVTLDDLRLIAVQPAANKAAKKGDRVLAQWQPNDWYQGKATKACAIGLHVVFDDGDKADRPVTLIAVDRAPKKKQVKTGTRVLALWTDERLYPGTVTKIGKDTFDIQFDDGSNRAVGLEDLRLLNE